MLCYVMLCYVGLDPEDGVRKGIARSQVPREELFILTKVS